MIAKVEVTTLESWRYTWREGIVPQLSRRHLQVLRDGLVNNDSRIVQGATCQPPPLQYVRDWPVEAACGLGYCGWQGDNLGTVAELEEFFARVCFEIDQRLGEPAACRWFLNWFDETPRELMIAALLAEVERALAQHDAYSVTEDDGEAD